MIELPLIFMAGLTGSAHCLGMCGPFALTIGGSSSSLAANICRQLLYTLGRVFTYVVIGAIAGFAGWRLTKSMPALVNVPATLAILAGVLLLYQGLATTGIFRKRSSTAPVPCLASSFFASFLVAPGLVNVFLAGMFTGLLPCGLLYGFFTLAAASHHMLRAATIMAVFGASTAPVMILTGCGGSLLSLAARRRLYQVAAWCVVLTGLVSIARGLGFLFIPGWFQPHGCPLCR